MTEWYKVLECVSIKTLLLWKLWLFEPSPGYLQISGKENYIINIRSKLFQENIITSLSCRVATNSDFDRISNTEYYSFLGIYEYRIPNNIRSWKLTNTEYRILFGQGKFTNTEYRIVLFGLNYSNTELFEHWNGPAYSNFRKECVNLAQMIKVIVNNVSAFKIINIFSHFLSQNVTLQGVF